MCIFFGATLSYTNGSIGLFTFSWNLMMALWPKRRTWRVTDLSRVDAVYWSEESSSSANNFSISIKDFFLCTHRLCCSQSKLLCRKNKFFVVLCCQKLNSDGWTCNVNININPNINYNNISFSCSSLDVAANNLLAGRGGQFSLSSTINEGEVETIIDSNDSNELEQS